MLGYVSEAGAVYTSTADVRVSASRGGGGRVSDEKTMKGSSLE